MRYDNVPIKEIIDEIAMGPFGSNIKVECFVDSGIPVLNGSNLNGFRLTEDEFRYVTKEKADSLGKANASKGDIVVTHRGTLGQIVYIPQNSTSDRYIISQSQFRVRCKLERVLPAYLVYYFHTPCGQYQLLSNKSQVGVPALGRPTSTFQNLIVPLPSLNQQKKIVDLLSCLDNKIELNNRINKNLEAQAQAIFKSWFVDFEPFQDGEFVESELGLIPKGWRVGKAEDFFDITIGKTPPRKEPDWFTNCPNAVKWVSIADMGKSGLFISETSELLTRESINKFNIKIVPDNTVLLSFKLTIGRVVITDGSMATNEAIAHFKSNFKPSVEYLYLMLKQYNYEALGNTSSIATAVNSKTIKAMSVCMPDNQSLLKFHIATAPLLLQIKNNLRQNRTLAALRDTLLPKLMSGEIRVPLEV